MVSSRRGTISSSLFCKMMPYLGINRSAPAMFPKRRIKLQKGRARAINCREEEEEENCCEMKPCRNRSPVNWTYNEKKGTCVNIFLKYHYITSIMCICIELHLFPAHIYKRAYTQQSQSTYAHAHTHTHMHTSTPVQKLLQEFLFECLC